MTMDQQQPVPIIDHNKRKADLVNQVQSMPQRTKKPK